MSQRSATDDIHLPQNQVSEIEGQANSDEQPQSADRSRVDISSVNNSVQRDQEEEEKIYTGSQFTVPENINNIIRQSGSSMVQSSHQSQVVVVTSMHQERDFKIEVTGILGATNDNSYPEIFNNIGTGANPVSSRFIAINSANQNHNTGQLNKTEDVQNSTFGTTQEAIEQAPKVIGRFRVQETSILQQNQVTMSQHNLTSDNVLHSSLDHQSSSQRNINNYATSLQIPGSAINGSNYLGGSQAIQSSSDNNEEESKSSIHNHQQNTNYSQHHVGPFERAHDSSIKQNMMNHHQIINDEYLMNSLQHHSPRTLNVSGSHSPLDYFDQQQDGRISQQVVSSTNKDALNQHRSLLHPAEDTPPRIKLGNNEIQQLSNSKSKSYTASKIERIVYSHQQQFSGKRNILIFNIIDQISPQKSNQNDEKKQYSKSAESFQEMENQDTGGIQQENRPTTEFDEENHADREDECSNPPQDGYGDDQEDQNDEFASVNSNHSEEKVPAVDPALMKIQDQSIIMPQQNAVIKAEVSENEADAEVEENDSNKNSLSYNPIHAIKKKASTEDIQIDLMESPKIPTQKNQDIIEDFYPDDMHLLKPQKDPKMLSPRQSEIRSDNSQHDLDSQNESYSMSSMTKELLHQKKKNRFFTRKISNDDAVNGSQGAGQIEPQLDANYDFAQNHNSSVASRGSRGSNSKINQQNSNHKKRTLRGNNPLSLEKEDEKLNSTLDNPHLLIINSPKFPDEHIIINDNMEEPQINNEDHQDQVNNIFSPNKPSSLISGKARHDSDINDIQMPIINISGQSPNQEKIISQNEINSRLNLSQQQQIQNTSPAKILKKNFENNLKDQIIEPSLLSNRSHHNNGEKDQADISEKLIEQPSESRLSKINQANNQILVQSPNGRKSIVEVEKQGNLIATTKKSNASNKIKKPVEAINNFESQRGESITSLNFKVQSSNNQKKKSMREEDYEQKGRFQCKNTSEFKDEASKKKLNHNKQQLVGYPQGQMMLEELNRNSGENYNENFEKKSTIQKQIRSFGRIESGFYPNASQQQLLATNQSKSGQYQVQPIMFHHLNPYHVYQSGQSPVIDQRQVNYESQIHSQTQNYLLPKRYQPSFLDSSKNLTLNRKLICKNSIGVDEENTYQLNTSRDQRQKLKQNINNDDNHNQTEDDEGSIHLEDNQEDNNHLTEEALKSKKRKNKGSKKQLKKKSTKKRDNKDDSGIAFQQSYPQTHETIGPSQYQTQGLNSSHSNKFTNHQQHLHFPAAFSSYYPYIQDPILAQQAHLNDFHNSSHYAAGDNHLTRSAPSLLYQQTFPGSALCCPNCAQSQFMQQQLIEIQRSQISMFNNFTSTLNNTVTQLIQFQNMASRPNHHHNQQSYDNENENILSKSVQHASNQMISANTYQQVRQPNMEDNDEGSESEEEIVAERESGGSHHSNTSRDNSGGTLEEQFDDEDQQDIASDEEESATEVTNAPKVVQKGDVEIIDSRRNTTAILPKQKNIDHQLQIRMLERQIEELKSQVLNQQTGSKKSQLKK